MGPLAESGYYTKKYGINHELAEYTVFVMTNNNTTWIYGF
jgi:hypothetical protein